MITISTGQPGMGSWGVSAGSITLPGPSHSALCMNKLSGHCVKVEWVQKHPSRSLKVAGRPLIYTQGKR